MSGQPKKPDLVSVTTINRDGSRYFLQPSEVKGRFTSWRRIVAAVLILIYIALPWIEINGYPAVFLDIRTREFHLFGLNLAARDLWLLFFLITGLGFTLFFVTALLGRLWCGWACPYTVFLDHIYPPHRILRRRRRCSGPQASSPPHPWTTEQGRASRGDRSTPSYFLVCDPHCPRLSSPTSSRIPKGSTDT